MEPEHPFFECVYCKVRTLLISAIIFLATHLHAQKDYFYAETLLENGQQAEAVRVLDHLIDSGAYADRPRFLMMTLNLAGSTKRYLKDTLGAKKCYEAAMACYDTLSNALQADNWNHREYYLAGQDLAWMHYTSGDYIGANKLLITIGYPDEYYSATGSDVLYAQEGYCGFRAKIFQRLNQPDSAFYWILKRRDNESSGVRTFDSIFDVRTNHIGHVKFVYYSTKSTDQDTKSPGYLYFVSWNDKENTQHSIWFVNPEIGRLQILGRSTWNMDDVQNFPGNCYDMSMSPDEKYLAVTCYTEGSNYIEVFSFPEILNEKRCVVKQSILAYPAAVEIKGWENSMIIVESEADLTRLNRKERLSPSDYPKDGDVNELFLFDMESGKYSKK